MRAIIVATVIAVSLGAVGAAVGAAPAAPAAPAVTPAAVLPALLGPHPHPLPGAELEEFPAKVHAWHARGEDKEGNELLLHSSSHIYLVGPDGKWVDGQVHVGEAVYFHPDFPSHLAAGKYKVKSTARWIDGEYEPEFEWEFTVKKAGDPKADRH